MPYVQQRRGTASALAGLSEIPLAGQIYYETDTGKLKVGNGVDTYANLEYVTDTSNLVDACITTPKLADTAVTNSKLATDSVSTDKIQADAVTSAKIAADAVGSSEIAAGAVGNGELASNAVIEAKIADDAVTFAKMQNVSANSLLGATNAGEVTQIVCRQIGRDILDDSTAADVRATISAVTQSDIDAAISNLVGQAPSFLNTLEEIADAISQDQSVSTGLLQQIASNDSDISALQTDVSTALSNSSTALTTSGINATSITQMMPKAGGTFTGVIQIPSGNTPSAPKIAVDGDTNTGIYSSAGDSMSVSVGGNRQLYIGATSVIVDSGAIYSPLFRAANDGTKDATAYGRSGDPHSGMYFPAANQTGISAGGNDRVNFNLNASTFYRNAGQPTIKADAGNSGYMIIDAAGGHLSLNHYTDDDVFLCYALGGSGDVIIGASTTNSYNPDNRKLLVEGDTETKGITYSDRYITDTNGSATDPAFEIDGTIDGTGWYTPSTIVNGGNSAGYGFAIAAAHNHVAEFGYKSHIGNGRPTIYNGGKAALLELNGNSRRGSLFGYNIYNSGGNANEAIGGEFLCIAQGGTSTNNPKGFKTKLQSQSANGLRGEAGHFQLSMESVTGSWGSAYGVHCELNIASSCTGSFTGSSAALFVDAVGKTANATYPSTDGIDNVYAIFQEGNNDNNRYDGTSWFRNNVHIVAGGDLHIETGQIKLPNGTSSVPAICFSADTDTGIKRNLNGNFDIVTAGVNRLSITTGGDIHTSSAGTVYLNNNVTVAGTLTATNGINVDQLAQSGASTGEYLKWDGSAWQPSAVSGGSGSSTLSGLTDTSVSTVSSGQMLWYNGSAWANTDFSTMLGLYGTLGGLNGVMTSGGVYGNAAGGHVLEYVSALSSWRNVPLSAAVNSHVMFDDLKDVSIASSPGAEAHLRYNYTFSKWENYHPEQFNSTSGGGVSINLSASRKIFTHTLNASGTHSVTLLNIPSISGVACTFTLVLKYGGSAGATTSAIVQWPSTFKWPGGTAPTLTNTGGKQDTFTFLSLDNGTTWLAHVGGQNF